MHRNKKQIEEDEGLARVLAQLELEESQHASRAENDRHRQGDEALAQKLQAQWDSERRTRAPSNTANDEALARLLQEEGSGGYTPIEYTANDEALARLFQEEESVGYTPSFNARLHQKLSGKRERLELSADIVQIQAEIEALKPIRQELDAIFQRAEDVHRYTGKLGQLCGMHYVHLDQRYQLSSQEALASAFERIRPEIMQLASTPQQASVQQILNAIAVKGAHFGEPETGMNMMFLLVNSWCLTGEYRDPQAGKQMILDNLIHNIDAGGGCDAGIAGRLIQPYTAFLSIALENKCEEMLAIEQAIRMSIRI